MTKRIGKEDRPVVMRDRNAAWVHYHGVNGKRYKAILGKTLWVVEGNPCYVAECKRNGGKVLRNNNYCLVYGTKEFFSFPRPSRIFRRKGMVFLLVEDGGEGVCLLTGTHRYPSCYHIFSLSLVIVDGKPLYIAVMSDGILRLLHGDTVLYETTRPLHQRCVVHGRSVHIWGRDGLEERVITLP